MAFPHTESCPVRQAIRTALQDLDLDPVEVSREIGKPGGFLAGYLNGNRQTLDSDTQYRLARYLGLPIRLLGSRPDTAEVIDLAVGGGRG